MLFRSQYNMFQCICGSYIKNIKPHLKTKKHISYETEMHTILLDTSLNKNELEKRMAEDNFQTLQEKLDCIQMILDMDCLEQQLLTGEGVCK